MHIDRIIERIAGLALYDVHSSIAVDTLKNIGCHRHRFLSDRYHPHPPTADVSTTLGHESHTPKAIHRQLTDLHMLAAVKEQGNRKTLLGQIEHHRLPHAVRQHATFGMSITVVTEAHLVITTVCRSDPNEMGGKFILVAHSVGRHEVVDAETIEGVKRNTTGLALKRVSAKKKAYIAT